MTLEEQLGQGPNVLTCMPPPPDTKLDSIVLLFADLALIPIPPPRKTLWRIVLAAGWTKPSVRKIYPAIVFPSNRQLTMSPLIAPRSTVLFLTVQPTMTTARKAYVAVITFPSRTRSLEAPATACTAFPSG